MTTGRHGAASSVRGCLSSTLSPSAPWAATWASGLLFRREPVGGFAAGSPPMLYRLSGKLDKGARCQRTKQRTASWAWKRCRAPHSQRLIPCVCPTRSRRRCVLLLFFTILVSRCNGLCNGPTAPQGQLQASKCTVGNRPLRRCAPLKRLFFTSLINPRDRLCGLGPSLWVSHMER